MADYAPTLWTNVGRDHHKPNSHTHTHTHTYLYHEQWRAVILYGGGPPTEAHRANSALDCKQRGLFHPLLRSRKHQTTFIGGRAEKRCPMWGLGAQVGGSRTSTARGLRHSHLLHLLAAEKFHRPLHQRKRRRRRRRAIVGGEIQEKQGTEDQLWLEH